MSQGKITIFGILLTILVAAVSAAPAKDASPAAGTAAMKAAVDAWLESWNTGGDHVDSFLSAGVTYKGPFNSTSGLQGYRDLIQQGRTVFSPAEFETDELVQDGDRVVVSWTVRATHSVLGKAVEMQGVSILRFAGEKIASEWRVYDGAELCRQLGGTVTFP